MTREEIARVIDPKAWKRFDRNATAYAAHITEAQRRVWDGHFVADSLAKADAILSKLHQDAGNGELVEQMATWLEGVLTCYDPNLSKDIVRFMLSHSPVARAADALERGSQVVDGLGRDVVDSLAEDAFNEGWRSREAILGPLINSRGTMRRAWLDSNARDAIHAHGGGG